jgi:cation transport protein ChaC
MLDLSDELIAKAFPATVDDDATAMTLASDAEVQASLETTLAGHGSSDGLWVFGYGSLMWRPELEASEQRLGSVSGLQRSFCLWQWRYRGTRAAPGLMLALDEGGTCTGVLYHLPETGLRQQLGPLWRREMTGRGYVPHWVDVDSAAGPVRAVTFRVNHAGPRYAGRLPVETVADHIASACGHAGPNATYLLETWRYCRRAGIEDAYVERLQRLVAERLRVRCGR